MKKILLIASTSFFFFGCNINPSKEARLQTLESEMQVAKDKIDTLEKKVQKLEETNGKLKESIPVLENK